MRFRILAITIILFFGLAVDPVSGITDDTWARIETGDNGISASFPFGYLVDAGTQKGSGRSLNITHFVGGVEMRFAVYRSSGPVGGLNTLPPSESANLYSFKKGRIEGVRATSSSLSSGYEEYLKLKSGKHLYIVSARTNDASSQVLARFLFSIRVNGEQLFKSKQEASYSESAVRADSLETSPEIKEAYDRKFEKVERNIEYLPYQDDPQGDPVEDFSRPPVIVDQPSIPFGRIIGNLQRSTPGRHEELRAKAKVLLTANGQVGDIVVYSTDGEAFREACADAAKKLRFVPAQRDGKNVDAYWIVNYTYIIETSNFYPRTN